MKKTVRSLAVLSTLAFMTSTFANVGAVIDSGTDFRHDKLGSKAWTNPRETINGLDDDSNKLIDDLNGWNFADNNNLVFDPKLKFSKIDYNSFKLFFEIQDMAERKKELPPRIVMDMVELLVMREIKMLDPVQAGLLEQLMSATSEVYSSTTQEERDLKTIAIALGLKGIRRSVVLTQVQAANLKNKLNLYINKLDLFGNYSHGTHVAGIMSKGNDKSKIVALKIMSTDTQAVIDMVTESLIKDGRIKKQDLNGGPVRKLLMKTVMKVLGSMKAKELKDFALYMKQADARVANCSWGASYEVLHEAVKGIADKIFGRTLPDYDYDVYTTMLLTKLNNKGERMIDHSPNTLFVFAAGNDGEDNDIRPGYPSNMESDNVITVAATVDDIELASFSNYGVENVEVAAPGVGIISTSPEQEITKMSGTSQAAPYVSNIALKVTEINSELSSGEVKRILMDTVDVKNFLKGKVKTSGMVNMERALSAAEFSKTMKLKKAIVKAFEKFPAKVENEREEKKSVVQKIKERFRIHTGVKLFK